MGNSEKVREAKRITSSEKVAVGWHLYSCKTLKRNSKPGSMAFPGHDSITNPRYNFSLSYFFFHKILTL